jgi:hypothetical protein
MPELPLVGTDFAGYRLRAVLGRGGMSIVYRAENPRLRNLIALKVLAPELADDQVFRTRFREESQIAASLNHPHVIPIHDFGASDGLLYIAMRYVSGTDLRHLIADRGWLAPYESVHLLEQVARALDAAHRRGLVHRDVKPGNLLIAQGGDEWDPDHLYLADFGITKYMGRPSGLTVAGTVLGTGHYISPEQIQHHTVLGAADQYSLGCVLYECLTGRAPFEEDSDEAIMWAHVHESPLPPSPLRPGLPPAIDAVFARVLAKDPEGRYANCREFITAARDALATASAAAPARDGWAPGPRTPDLGGPGLRAPDFGGPGPRAPDFGEPDFGEPGPRTPDFSPPGGFRRAPAATPSRGLRDLGRDPAAQPREPAASTGPLARTPGPSAGLPTRTTGPNAGLPTRTTGPSTGLPARTTGPSTGLPAGATGPGAGLPAGTTGPGAGLPAGTTGPGAWLPAGATGPTAGLPDRTTGANAWMPGGTTGPEGPAAVTTGPGGARVPASPAGGRHRLARHRAPERRGLRSVLGLLTELIRRRPPQHHTP